MFLKLLYLSLFPVFIRTILSFLRFVLVAYFGVFWHIFPLVCCKICCKLTLFFKVCNKSNHSLINLFYYVLIGRMRISVHCNLNTGVSHQCLYGFYAQASLPLTGTECMTAYMRGNLGQRLFINTIVLFNCISKLFRPLIPNKRFSCIAQIQKAFHF